MACPNNYLYTRDLVKDTEELENLRIVENENNEGMEDEMYGEDYSEYEGDGYSPKVKVENNDKEVQTELHPIPSNMVKGYFWNEWDLRRKALLLARLEKCSTHSTQTNLNLLTESEGVQTTGQMNRWVQTKTDFSSETQERGWWIYGLRGEHPLPPHVVELSKDPCDDLRCFVPPPPKAKCDLEEEEEGDDYEAEDDQELKC